MPSDPETSQVEPLAALEAIPHLTRKICGIWGTDEVDVFLNRLIMDSRDGARQGFPVEIAAEIMLLIQINKVIRAMDLGKRLDMHLGDAYRRIDEGDQARLRTDALDDPTISRDTVVSRGKRATDAPERRALPRDGGTQAQGLGQLLSMLIRSKWIWGALLLLIGVKYVWPILKALA